MKAIDNKELIIALEELEKEKGIKKEEQQQHEPCVHLGEDISPDEFEEMLSRFHSNHAHVKIIIYDSEQISFLDNESGWIR